jgi:hypothetical protein
MMPSSIPSDVFHDIRGPVLLADGVWWVILLLVVLIFSAWLFFLKKGKKIFKAVETPVLVIPPWETALKELLLLEKGVWQTKEQVMEFYVRLSLTVRHYIEMRFNIRAVEMTTEEFMTEMSRSSLLTKEHQVFLKEFLAGSDRVKFAGSMASMDEMKQTLETARSFVVKTIPVENVGGVAP